jgi:two-component system, chemotaxis family, chemotaxis protein CheY
MRTLIVEDEQTCRQILQAIMTPFGECDTVTDGEEAIQVFRKALDGQKPYDLILMDIMMPKMDGQTALRDIRQIEKDHGIRSVQRVKVIMTTALEDQKNVIEAFYKGGASSYIVKPVEKQKLLAEIKKLGLNQ